MKTSISSSTAPNPPNSIIDPYTRSKKDRLDPPRGFWRSLRHLGPGMILVGSVVGSGELIMTTKLGAVAGFTLLWFVLVSCFIKVVVQAELARYTISSGKTFLRAFNELPGPAGRRPRWLTLPWLAIVTLVCVFGVTSFVHLPSGRQTWSVALALAVGAVFVSITAAMVISYYRSARQNSAFAEEKQDPNSDRSPVINWFLWLWMASMLLVFVNSGAILGAAGQTLQMALPIFGEGGAKYWALALALAAGAILLTGTYASLEKTLVVMVSSFTLLTLVCTVLLQWTNFAITTENVAEGLRLHFPAPLSASLILTALAMYAGTGVAYGEMWNYTYWCVEKGYAKSVGEPNGDPAWTGRARGWIRVMYLDVLVTMVVYTISTVCFYFLGAAVLNVQSLNPDGRETLQVLSNMYTGSLGNWAAVIFIAGAFFVLFSTVVAGAAGNSRLIADGLGVMGVIDSQDYSVRKRFIRVFVVVSLVLYSIAYWLFENPPQMLQITSSLIAAAMYPTLGLGVLYLRHRRVDARIAPGRATTTWLWFCALALTIISPGGILLTLAIQAGWISLS